MSRSIRNLAFMGGIALIFIGFSVIACETIVTAFPNVAMWTNRIGRMISAIGFLVLGLTCTLRPRGLPSLSLVRRGSAPPGAVFLGGCICILSSGFLFQELVQDIFM